MAVQAAEQARVSRWHVPMPSVSVLSLLGGLLLWEVAGRTLQLDFLPPFSEVLAALADMVGQGLILGSLVSSLWNLAIGFGISVAVGVPIGILMGAYPKVEAALDIYVYGLLTAPSLVFAPIFFAIFGVGPQTIIGVIIMYAIFIIIIDTAAAVQTVPKAMIEMGTSFCASERQLVRRIILPAAAPMIMAGVHAGAGRAVKGMINGEMFIAVVGLGAVLMRAGEQFNAARLIAVLVVVTGVAMVLLWLLDRLDARMNAWLPSNRTKNQRRRVRPSRPPSHSAS